MKRVSVVVALLVAVGLLADKYYPYDPQDDDEVYYAQNFDYVNPHLRMDGSYAPGFYRPLGNSNVGNPTPEYFPVGKYQTPYSTGFAGANYFAPTVGSAMVPGGMNAPYFFPPP